MVLQKKTKYNTVLTAHIIQVLFNIEKVKNLLQLHHVALKPHHNYKRPNV